MAAEWAEAEPAASVALRDAHLTLGVGETAAALGVGQPWAWDDEGSEGESELE